MTDTTDITNIKFNDLTDEQLDAMPKEQLVNKALSEYVVEINSHVTSMEECVKHMVISPILIMVLFPFIGFYSLFGLLWTGFWSYGYFRLKYSIVWHVRAFKSTSALYSSCGYSDLCDIHKDNINDKVVIGDDYFI